MPWTDTILEQFELINRFTTDESEFYGPYNTLLTDLFPHAEHYQVAPQFKGPVTLGSVNFTMIYIVRKHKYPVFFIEIKPYIHLNDIRTQAKADQQMRERFGSMIGPSLAIPNLYGVSAMGTRFSVYQYMKETNILKPSLILPDPNYVTDVAPAARWNYELLEIPGEQKMRELVAEIKRMCNKIVECEFMQLLPCFTNQKISLHIE